MAKIYLVVFLLLGFGIKLHGQDSDADLFDLSLEELMNIDIVSASKKAESSFLSPLSSTVVTSDEILASGATTIEEALRLVPGMLVREASNGNFDVHIRGNDNLPPGGFILYSANTMTLVMIDGRPVYNSINGGTFWESLPIGLVDVEKIEVVRGPSSALYGPNAATGVINIITKQETDRKISVQGNAQLGNKNTEIYGLALGTSLLNDKLKIRVNGNIENRDRDMETYYSYVQGEYLPGDQVLDYVYYQADAGRFPNPNLAKERKGANALVSYQLNDKVNFRVHSGLQESYAQAIFWENNTTPLELRYNESAYVDVAAEAYGLNIQYSLNNGVADIMAGNRLQGEDPLSYLAYDFEVANLNVEYDWNIGNLSIRPGFNYQSAVYSDLDYRGGIGLGYVNNERGLYNTGYFIRADFKASDKLRLIGAFRFDTYNVPNDNYTSFQLGGTYSINKDHLVRVLFGKANRGPFLADSYTNYRIGDGSMENSRVEIIGSEVLDLPTINEVEVGYRGLFSSKFTLDLEVFFSVVSNANSFEWNFFGVDPEKGLLLRSEYTVLDLEARQLGATFALNYAPTSKLQLRAYATIQQTNLKDYDKKLTSYGFDPATGQFFLPMLERMNTVHKQTPALFGGINGNYRPFEKLNLYAGLYYLGPHTFRHDYAAFNEDNGQVDVSGKAVFNLKASYNLYKNNSIFINARNVFNSKGQEFGFADEIGGLYLAGVNLSF
jgi:iron complex outermembrane receptor protein